MTVLRNNFDGGPDGTNLTAANSGQVPGNDAFQVTSTIGAGVVLKYKDAATFERGTAEYVLHTATGGSGGACACVWTTAMGTQTEVWWRQYVRLDELPVTSGHSTGAAIFECDNGAAYTGFVQIGRTDGVVTALNGPETSQLSTTTPLTLGVWARIEARFKISTTAGEVDLKMYLDADSDTPTEEFSATGWNMGAASANSWAFGQSIAHSNKPDCYFSGIELNNEGWPGPAPFRAGRGVPGILSTPIAVHTDTW